MNLLSSDMSQAQNAFVQSISEAANTLRRLSPSTVVLLHHNDTDGLTSGAVLSKVFERKGYEVRRYCLEKPYPLVVERIMRGFDDCDVTYVLTDFASGMLGTLQELNLQQRPLFVLDHHTVGSYDVKLVQLVNCRSHGISGDSECSAGTTCALFAEELHPHSTDLGVLGLLGAVGDRQCDEQGRFKGMNELLAKSLEQRGALSRANGEFKLRMSNGSAYDAVPLTRSIDALGAYGYLRGGSDVAIKGLLEGFDERYTAVADHYLNEFDEAYRKLLATSPFLSTPYLTHFSLSTDFALMGVKSVGLVCERVRDEGRCSSDNYIVGLQSIPTEIPGLGSLPLNATKISLRLGTSLTAKVRAGSARPISEVLVQPTRLVGGFLDACHAEAGAITVPTGREPEFLTLLGNEIAGGRKASSC